MGWLFKDAKATVVVVGLSEQVAAKLKPQLLKMGAEDPGAIELHQVQTLAECRNLVDSQKITGICIQLEAFPAAHCTAFISDIRITHPLISFCLVGSSYFLSKFPNYHENWKQRFAHYFQLRADASADDFDQNAGVLRDLFIADVVKSKALGQYQTTPGALIRLKAASPYGFWITLAALLITAIIGGSVAPVFERVFPAPRPRPARHQAPARQPMRAITN